jgi:hypothetical protein
MMQSMKVTDDLISKILDPELEDDEDNFDRLEWQEREIERLPDKAVEIACFEDEVDHSPGLSWQISCTYYAVPIGDPGAYALFVLDWDDNWGRWGWEVQGAVSGAASINEAGKFLMAQLARERITKDKSAYNSFLKKFL